MIEPEIFSATKVTKFISPYYHWWLTSCFMTGSQSIILTVGGPMNTITNATSARSQNHRASSADAHISQYQYTGTTDANRWINKWEAFLSHSITTSWGIPCTYRTTKRRRKRSQQRPRRSNQICCTVQHSILLSFHPPPLPILSYLPLATTKHTQKSQRNGQKKGISPTLWKSAKGSFPRDLRVTRRLELLGRGLETS